MMRKLFEYNWQVRDEWFQWCGQLTLDELLKERKGGVGNILYTLFHIIEVEYSWIRALQGKEDIIFQFGDYSTLAKVKSLSNSFRDEIKDMINTNLEASKDKLVRVSWDEDIYKFEDILHHLITHEIHHIGQLSIWARDIGLNPVPANFIGRKLPRERNNKHY